MIELNAFVLITSALLVHFMYKHIDDNNSATIAIVILLCGFQIQLTDRKMNDRAEERFCAVNPTVEMCQEKE